MLVCHCNGVSDRAIRKALRSGADSAAQVGAMTGAGTCCGGCSTAIKELVRGEVGARQSQAETTTVAPPAVSS